MESRIQQAIDRHHKGYNCAQAVVCTYADLLGVDEETAFRISEGFGLGMGMQSVCGALSGVLMLLSLQNSGGTQAAGTTKRDTYAKACALEQAFRKEVGAIDCSEIKSPPAMCSCDGCVQHAAKLAEQYLLNS